MKKTLIEMLLKSGYKREDMFHHYSDLYIFDTPETRKIISRWAAENGYNEKLFVSKFHDNVTGRPMFDCAFQWYEF